eukprot:1245888-Alexandrium_andersonii.AAC.1
MSASALEYPGKALLNRSVEGTCIELQPLPSAGVQQPPDDAAVAPEAPQGQARVEGVGGQRARAAAARGSDVLGAHAWAT